MCKEYGYQGCASLSFNKERIASFSCVVAALKEIVWVTSGREIEETVSLNMGWLFFVIYHLSKKISLKKRRLRRRTFKKKMDKCRKGIESEWGRASVADLNGKEGIKRRRK